MKLLADHCVYGQTVRLLRSHGFEIHTLKELHAAHAEDTEVIRMAHDLKAILLTNDLDFANILNYPPVQFGGIIVLRIGPKSTSDVHHHLLRFLRSQDSDSIRGQLVVIDDRHVRVRKG